MLDHLLESSHRDDSNKGSNIGFNEEMTQEESLEVNFTHLILGARSQILTHCILGYKMTSV